MKDGVMPKGTACILIILLAGVLKEFSRQQCNLSATVVGMKTLIFVNLSKK